jgi:hypothetical protein
MYRAIGVVVYEVMDSLLAISGKHRWGTNHHRFSTDMCTLPSFRRVEHDW